jgi:hypothetical protein
MLKTWWDVDSSLRVQDKGMQAPEQHEPNKAMETDGASRGGSSPRQPGGRPHDSIPGWEERLATGIRRAQEVIPISVSLCWGSRPAWFDPPRRVVLRSYSREVGSSRRMFVDSPGSRSPGKGNELIPLTLSIVVSRQQACYTASQRMPCVAKTMSLIVPAALAGSAAPSKARIYGSVEWWRTVALLPTYRSHLDLSGSLAVAPLQLAPPGEAADGVAVALRPLATPTALVACRCATRTGSPRSPRGSKRWWIRRRS